MRKEKKIGLFRNSLSIPKYKIQWEVYLLGDTIYYRLI